MFSIAVTGASGFVGKNLVPYLESTGYKVFSISRIVKGNNALQVSYEDLTPAFIQANSIDVIIHLAGKAHDLKNTIADEEYYEINTRLTQKVYDVFRNSVARQFFFMSTVKAVADNVIGEITELTLPNPATVYGKSKRLAEEYLLQHISNDKQVYILRPCMIHGSGNKGNLNLLYKFVLKNLPWPLAAYDNKRSFLYIENLCFSITKFIGKRDVPSGVYQLADSGVLSTNRLISILASVLNHQPKLLKIPLWLINFAASIGSVLHLPLNRERLGKLTNDYVVNNHKLLTVLGEPLPVSIEKGIELTARSFSKKA